MCLAVWQSVCSLAFVGVYIRVCVCVCTCALVLVSALQKLQVCARAVRVCLSSVAKSVYVRLKSYSHVMSVCAHGRVCVCVCVEDCLSLPPRMCVAASNLLVSFA